MKAQWRTRTVTCQYKSINFQHTGRRRGWGWWSRRTGWSRGWFVEARVRERHGRVIAAPALQTRGFWQVKTTVHTLGGVDGTANIFLKAPERAHVGIVVATSLCEAFLPRKVKATYSECTPTRAKSVIHADTLYICKSNVVKGGANVVF